MKYRYVGNGDGVPGLPAEISDEEAAALGVSEMLRAAVENGNYAPVGADDGASTAPLRGSAQRDEAPLQGRRGRRPEQVERKQVSHD